MVHTLSTAKDLDANQHAEESQRLNQIIKDMEVQNQEHSGSLARLQEELETSEMSRLWSSKQLVSTSMELHELEEQMEALRSSNDEYIQQITEIKSKLEASEKEHRELEARRRSNVDQV